MSRASTRDVIDVLSVTGGIPKYLEDIRPTFSSDENIRRLCFCSSGMLVKEFEEIFANVFEGNASAKREILESLANGPLEVPDLAAVLGKERNGHLSAALCIRTALVYEGALSKAVDGDGYDADANLRKRT